MPLVLAAILLAGCKEEAVTVYTIPKEIYQPHVDVQPQLSWTTLPDDWEQQAAGGMRLASFSITGANGGSADVSVTSFAGQVGSDLANANR